jgi:hypothetical protein
MQIISANFLVSWIFHKNVIFYWAFDDITSVIHISIKQSYRDAEKEPVSPAIPTVLCCMGWASCGSFQIEAVSLVRALKQCGLGLISHCSSWFEALCHISLLLPIIFLTFTEILCTNLLFIKQLRPFWDRMINWGQIFNLLRLYLLSLVQYLKPFYYNKSTRPWYGSTVRTIRTELLLLKSRQINIQYNKG